MNQVKTIPVFHPTFEEFTSGFSNYVTSIQPLCTKYGLAKIVPPPEWNVRESNWFENSIRRMVIPSPIYQYVSGLKGIFQQTNIVDKAMKLTDFRKHAEEHLDSRLPANSDEEIERRFWKNIRFEPPIYGADMKGSLFPPELYHWNVARLTDQNLLKHLQTHVDGVNTPYLYFGMWKAMFSWHTEDMDLFSINYLHHGEPKRWYVIPEAERHRFEQLCTSHFPELEKLCKNFLRHKTTMISPTILKQANISVFTGVQREGEFIITFPGAYHAGFNHGFNCAESVNFAVDSWISRGLKATICQCKQDNVSINMEIFLKNYKQEMEREQAENKEKIQKSNSEEDTHTTSPPPPENESPLAPTFVLDHLETPETKEQINITISVPGAGKAISKKKSRGKRSTKNSSSSHDLSDKNTGSSITQFKTLFDLSDDQIPTSLVPSTLVQAYTAL